MQTTFIPLWSVKGYYYRKDVADWAGTQTAPKMQGCLWTISWGKCILHSLPTYVISALPTAVTQSSVFGKECAQQCIWIDVAAQSTNKVIECRHEGLSTFIIRRHFISLWRKHEALYERCKCAGWLTCCMNVFLSVHWPSPDPEACM